MNTAILSVIDWIEDLELDQTFETCDLNYKNCPNKDNFPSKFDTTDRDANAVAALNYTQNYACLYDGLWDNRVEFNPEFTVDRESMAKILARLNLTAMGQAWWIFQTVPHSAALLTRGIFTQAERDLTVFNQYQIVQENTYIDLIRRTLEYQQIPQDVIDAKVTELFAVSWNDQLTRYESLVYASFAISVINEYAPWETCDIQLLDSSYYRFGVPNSEVSTVSYGTVAVDDE